MNCNSGQRKVFADDFVASITELAKKHGLDDVVVHRDADPVLIAARGCLKGDAAENDEQRIEFVVQISPDLGKADERSLEGAEVAGDAIGDVLRAFDLSEVVSSESVAKAATFEKEEC